MGGTSEDSSNEKQNALAFECNRCGQRFESWDRQRQHEIDCDDDAGGDQWL
jgi:hypothetical protein